MSAGDGDRAGVPAAATRPFENRFHLVAVACRRVMQIRDGARPRVDPGRHKPCVVAVAEVAAGTIAYSVE